MVDHRSACALAGTGEASRAAVAAAPAACDAAEARAALWHDYGLRPVEGLPGVWRSRSLARADVVDVDRLLALGIRHVIDLRDHDERARLPYDPAVRVLVSVEERPLRFRCGTGRRRAGRAADAVAAYGAPGERMLRLYRGLGARRAPVIEAVRTLEAACSPVLVHCENGKDRAGVVCALAQLRAGVAPEAVRAAYLAANEANRSLNQADLAREAPRRRPEELAVLRAMFEARAEYLDAFLGAFGSWDF